MFKRHAATPRLLVADPDNARRAGLIAAARGFATIEAASLSEAFDLAESQEPDAIALAVELAGESGLDMFLHLIDALSVGLVVYGQSVTERTPRKLKAFVTMVEHRGAASSRDILDALMGGGARPAAGKPPSAGPAGAADSVADGASSGARLIVIGASTGGVNAIEVVLSGFPADCPPTLVVQHIRAGFVDGMARRLDAKCRPQVLTARDSMPIGRGQVCIAADEEKHLILCPGEPLRCRLKEEPPRHGHRPSVDALFESVAGRRGVSAALLTGMGADGAAGLGRIRAGGGLTIAQNEATCVVYGMPRVAVENGAATEVLPLDRIAARLLSGPGRTASGTSGGQREAAR